MRIYAVCGITQWLEVARKQGVHSPPEVGVVLAEVGGRFWQRLVCGFGKSWSVVSARVGVKKEKKSGSNFCGLYPISAE